MIQYNINGLHCYLTTTTTTTMVCIVMMGVTTSTVCIVMIHYNNDSGLHCDDGRKKSTVCIVTMDVKNQRFAL